MALAAVPEGEEPREVDHVEGATELEGLGGGGGEEEVAGAGGADEGEGVAEEDAPRGGVPQRRRVPAQSTRSPRAAQAQHAQRVRLGGQRERFERRSRWGEEEQEARWRRKHGDSKRGWGGAHRVQGLGTRARVWRLGLKGQESPGLEDWGLGSRIGGSGVEGGARDLEVDAACDGGVDEGSLEVEREPVRQVKRDDVSFQRLAAPARPRAVGSGCVWVCVVLVLNMPLWGRCVMPRG